MKKICTYCSLELDAENDFNWEYKNRGKRQARCKYCQSKLGRLHYQNNKQTYNERTRIYKAQVLTENASHIEVRCTNCHRIKTIERGGFWRNLFGL